MRQIVKVHYPDIKEQLLTTALTNFMKSVNNRVKKKPSTSEVWIAKVVVGRGSDARGPKRDAGNLLPKLHGALLKNEQDVQLFERLALCHGANGLFAYPYSHWRT